MTKIEFTYHNERLICSDPDIYVICGERRSREGGMLLVVQLNGKMGRFFVSCKYKFENGDHVVIWSDVQKLTPFQFSSDQEIIARNVLRDALSIYDGLFNRRKETIKVMF